MTPLYFMAGLLLFAFPRVLEFLIAVWLVRFIYWIVWR